MLLHGKVRQVPHQFAYYVDFLEQLQSVLQCKDILSCVDNPKPPSSEFRSALDGYVYQNHPISQKYPNALAVIFYLDDIKAGDTLSTYGDLGLRNYLWTLANIHPELRSSVRAIQLLALAKASDAKFVKNGPILKNFIEGLNKLSSEEGVTFYINGVPRVFHGFLLFVVGDYPALGNIGGFKESVFAWRFCRQCMVTKDEMREKYEEGQVKVRTEAAHLQHLEALEGTSAEEEEDDEQEEAEESAKPSVKYGVNYRSPLLQVNFFQLTQCLPQNIMHLFMEGILELECRLLLQHAVSSKKISLKEINLYLSALPGDRPSPIESQHLKNGLRQTSAQILTLSFLLPFIIGKHCQAERLENFILLLKIVKMCLSHSHTLDSVSLLREMIKKYLQAFNRLNPGKFTSKHHFLIHLPNQIIMFSILTEQWAMRFEAFHAILKRLAKILHNAKNLSFSLITRLSSLQAYKMHMHKEDYVMHTAVVPKVRERKQVSQTLHEQHLIHSLKLTEDCACEDLSTLKWYGHELSQGDIVLISREVPLPKFAAVVSLFRIQEKYFIVYRELNTIEYRPKLEAFLVKCEVVAPTSAVDITSNFYIKKLQKIHYENEDFVILCQDNQPHF